MTISKMDLDTMTTDELATRYEKLWGKPPRIRHRRYLAKRVAWKVDPANARGLSVAAQAVLERLITELGVDFTKLAPAETGFRRTRMAKGLAPGTSLTRHYKGHDLIVRVLENGFEHDGVRHRTLSALAKTLTNSHLSGPRFFGLTKRREQGS